MNSLYYFIFYFLVLLSCVVTLAKGDPSLTNYVPVVWGLIGFGLTGLLYNISWLTLSKKLIDDHEGELKEKGICYTNNGFKKTVYMFDILGSKSEIGSISDEIKSRVSNFETYFILMTSAFALMIVYVFWIAITA